MGSKNWIAGAIKKPGVEKAAAKKAGMRTEAYMEKNEDKTGKAGQQSGDRINADFDPVDVDPGKPGRLFVTAHGDDLFAQRRVAHY